MTRSATSPAKRLIALLLAVLFVLGAGACSGDDDDDGGSASASGSASGSASEPSDDGEDSSTDVEETEELEPEEARAEGNPDVYQRIASADCAQLADELEAHEENAESREAQGDHRRASILRAYAEETRARMDELSCPENAGETTTTTAAT